MQGKVETELQMIKMQSLASHNSFQGPDVESAIFLNKNVDVIIMPNFQNF